MVRCSSRSISWFVFFSFHFSRSKSKTEPNRIKYRKIKPKAKILIRFGFRFKPRKPDLFIFFYKNSSIFINKIQIFFFFTKKEE